MVHVDSVKLATGAELPLFGLGTWQSTDPTALTEALKVALDIGYRLIDTAYIYGNEAVIGKVLKEYFTSGKLKREDVFITTKLPFYSHAPDDVENMINGQLKDLQLDYVDLYLIHCPLPFKRQPGGTHGNYQPVIENEEMVPDLIDHLDTWRAMEKVFKSGKAKAIGLSNFNEEQIQNIIDHATVKPHNLQVEAHIYWPQNELFEFCKKNNITFTAYAPLGSPGRKAFNPDMTWPDAEPLKEPIVLELAKKYNKTPAQILLRQLVQRGMSAIPKSTNPDRVRENFNIFDFKLTDEDFNRLCNIKNHTRLCLFDFAKHHPFFPFKDVDVSKLKKVPMKRF